MRLHALQHVPFEGLGHIEHWIAEQGHRLTVTHLYDGEELPRLDWFDGLVIMGGPMNIYEDAHYPWLKTEKILIRQSIDAGKSAIGICLGAQLLADALGSPVFAGKEKEIGWLPITLTENGRKSYLLDGLPHQTTVFHWHGETFDIPEGAVHLAESEGCHSQAFLFDNRILGLQFHLESTPETIRAILDHCRHELVPGRYIQTEEQINAAPNDHFVKINTMLEMLLKRVF